MFKKRQFKIRVSGCSGIAIIGALIIFVIALAITLPLFGFFGLSILLAKYQLSHLEFFGHWYQNVLYFGWFLLLVFGIVFLIDFIGLFIIATFNIEYNIGVNIVSTLIQYGICLWIYHQVLMSIFNHIDVNWLGSCITVAIIYLVISVFTSTAIVEEES